MANSTRFLIELPDNGADSDQWGTLLNNAFSSLEQKVTDRTAGDTINGALTVTGALSGNTVSGNTVSGNGANLTNLNAGNLASGTIPDARFPATLPAVSGANLTNLNAGNLATGTVPSARLSGTYAINITGNAATATSAANGGVTSVNGRTGAVSVSENNPDVPQSGVTAIGAYIFAAQPGGSLDAGATINGASLSYSDSNGQAIGSPGGGTWRLHGVLRNSGTLWQRVG